MQALYKYTLYLRLVNKNMFVHLLVAVYSGGGGGGGTRSQSYMRYIEAICAK